MSGTALVHVVDDHPEVRASLALLLKSVAIEVRTYAGAEEFLASFEEMPGCPTLLLLDVRMPGMSGMALLERLRADCPALPIIMITGHGDIDMAVRAMKLGAVDFVTKPFGSQRLLDRVQEVLRQSGAPPAPVMAPEAASKRLGLLTSREREVFDRIVTGDSNKAIARDLGISVRTVESHRASVMEKVEAKTLVDLVLLSVSQKTTPK
jgi:FixJ family two-component response regulator